MSCINAIGRIQEDALTASGKVGNALCKAFGDVQNFTFNAIGIILGRSCFASGCVQDSRLEASGSIVCSIKDIAFVRVNPTEVQWITDYSSVTYEVMSNTDWEVIVD